IGEAGQNRLLRMYRPGRHPVAAPAGVVRGLVGAAGRMGGADQLLARRAPTVAIKLDRGAAAPLSSPRTRPAVLPGKAARQVASPDPILLALLGAILTLLGNMVVSFVNNRNTIAQERLKAASDLDLE